MYMYIQYKRSDTRNIDEEDMTYKGNAKHGDVMNKRLNENER
jgi:hypothetical protein